MSMVSESYGDSFSHFIGITPSVFSEHALSSDRYISRDYDYAVFESVMDSRTYFITKYSGEISRIIWIDIYFMLYKNTFYLHLHT